MAGRTCRPNTNTRGAHREVAGFSSHPVMRLKRPILVACLILLAVGSGSAAPPPDFRLKDTKGELFRLNDHLGKDVMYITFWATWCVPCRREMPELQKMSDELADQGFMVITINTDPAAAKSKIQPFLKRHKLKLLTLLDPDNNVHDKFNPTRELPYAILVDRKGEVHKTYAGYRKGDEDLLRRDVEKLLAEVPQGTEADD
jgi:peroxiredoxin